jgi:hypothetical protein
MFIKIFFFQYGEPSFSHCFVELSFGRIQNAQIYILYVKLPWLEYEKITVISETVIGYKLLKMDVYQLRKIIMVFVVATPFN